MMRDSTSVVARIKQTAPSPCYVFAAGRRIERFFPVSLLKEVYMSTLQNFSRECAQLLLFWRRFHE